MKKAFFLSLIFFLFILYYFLFPLSAAKEYIWIPVLVQSLDEADGKAFPLLDKPVVLRTGGYTGIMDNDEESIIRDAETIEMAENALVRAYSSSHTFESTGSNSTILRNRINNRYVLFQGDGYPFILEDHYFLGNLSAGKIREVGTTGEILWEWEGVSPVTALAAGSLSTAFGTLDGNVYIHRKDGNEGSLRPLSDNQDSVIYGLALSLDSSLMAVVAGLDKQVLVIYSEKSPLVYRESRRLSLKSRYARTVRVVIPEGSSSVWVEQPRQILRVSETGEETFYPVPGELLTMIPDERNGVVYILSALDSGQSLITIRSVAGDSLMREKIEGIPTHFELEESQLSLVIDGKFILLKRESF